MFLVPWLASTTVGGHSCHRGLHVRNGVRRRRFAKVSVVRRPPPPALSASAHPPCAGTLPAPRSADGDPLRAMPIAAATAAGGQPGGSSGGGRPPPGHARPFVRWAALLTRRLPFTTTGSVPRSRRQWPLPPRRRRPITSRRLTGGSHGGGGGGGGVPRLDEKGVPSPPRPVREAATPPPAPGARRCPSTVGPTCQRGGPPHRQRRCDCVPPQHGRRRQPPAVREGRRG